MNGEMVRHQRTLRGLSQARFSELCGIRQPALSAFELGKAQLTAAQLQMISQSLSNGAGIERLIRRRKRYRQGESPSFIGPDRSPLATKSGGNRSYVLKLDELWSAAHRSSHSRSALTLFSGCGGMSLGLKAAGFQVKGYLEKDPDAREIYARNFPEAKCGGTDIAAVSDRRIRDWLDQSGSIDLLAGGPPCQGFSLAGKRRVDDTRNDLFKQYLRVLDIVRPRAAILENVRLLTSMKNANGGLVRDAILGGFEQLGYRVNAFQVNAKDYGVPQHRERVIFIAFRSDLGIEPSPPRPTHGVGADLFSPSSPYVTFADACSDLPYIESGGMSNDPLHRAVQHPPHVIRWLWDVPQGKSAHDNPDPKDRPPSGYNTTYKRQVWNEPGGAVQTTFGMISGCRNVHPIATRSLTIREAARLQSFPDDFEFQGNLTSVRTCIGNAVPPLLAEVFGTHILGLLA